MNAAALFSVSRICESAMNATPSAPWSTSRRVDEWSTCPGTVNTLTRRLIALGVLAAGPACPLGPEDEREHVEEERAVVLRLERHEPPAAVLARELVERAQVGRLPAERRPVVDELHRHFPGGKI